MHMIFLLLIKYVANSNVHSESKKLCHYTFVRNFDTCWPIFKILSLLYSQEICNKTHATMSTTR